MLQIGILIESKKVPVWVSEAITEIGLLKNIQCAFVIQHNRQPSSAENLYFKIFKKLDSSLLSGKPNLSYETDLIMSKEVPWINFSSLSSANTTQELEKIRARHVDIILHFGADIFSQQILELPKLGVWRFKFGKQKYPYESAGFWEWFHKSPITEIALEEIKDALGGAEGIASSSIKTEYLSFSRNQTALYAKAIDLLVNTISKVSLSVGLPEMEDRFKSAAPINSKEPNLWNLLSASWKLVSRAIIKFMRKKLFVDQWVIFYSFIPEGFPKLDFKKYIELSPPKDRIWADPFVVSENGRHYVFIEELMLKTKKGHLSCLVLNHAGKIESSKVILEKPYHLSYPQVFQHQNIWYMIPESGENNTVDVFECTSFPFHWKFKQSILTNVQAYDTTIHFQNGKYWLFCTIKKREGASTDDDLYLFYTDDFLANDWKPHPKNPVLSDPSVARPAGKIFAHQNNLYRPSQIGVPRYGYGLALNKIVELNEFDYKEETVNKVLPNWRKDLQSVHTLNFTESISVIDGQLKRFRF